jgi:polar amino acid transport system permease protein
VVDAKGNISGLLDIAKLLFDVMQAAQGLRGGQRQLADLFEAETLRGGLTSLPRGQAEAARALGLSRGQTLRHVLLPQTFRRVLPTLGNDLICLLKDSALVSVLGVRDITQEARLYQSATFRYTESLVLLAFFYLALTLLVALAVRALENRYRRHAA